MNSTRKTGTRNGAKAGAKATSRREIDGMVEAALRKAIERSPVGMLLRREILALGPVEVSQSATNRANSRTASRTVAARV